MTLKKLEDHNPNRDECHQDTHKKNGDENNDKSSENDDKLYCGCGCNYK